MKNFLLLIFISLFVSQLTYGQAIWHQYQGPYCGNIESFTSIGDTIYGNANETGIFRSVDNGYTWVHINGKLNGTLKTFYPYGNRLLGSNWQILYSDNYGKDWNYYPEMMHVNQFYLFKNRLFGCGKGIFMYDSLANSWIKKSNNFESDESRSCVLCLSSIGNILFCGTWENGLFKSTDDGVNWNKVTISPNNEINNITKIINFNDTLMILPINNTCIYLSADSGKTWNETNRINEGWGWGTDLTVFKNQIFLASSVGLYKFNSMDLSWDLISKKSYNHLFVKDSIFLASNNTGIYRWEATIDSFIPSNTGINTAQVNDIAMFNKSIYCATGVGIFYTSDDGLNWNLIPESENIYCNSFKVNDSVLYVGTDHGLFVTTIDSNCLFHPIPDLATEVVWDIEIVDTTFYATTNTDLFKSTDKGISWSRIKNSNYALMKIAYGNNLLLFTSTNGLYQLSGDSLKKIGFDEDYIETVKIIDGNVFVSPSMPERGIYKSLDSCKTWTKYLDIEVYDITKRGKSNLYASSIVNIYYSADDGITWETWSEVGMPDYRISCIIQSDSCFYAGTIGNSIYKRNYLGLTDCIFSGYDITNDSVKIPPNTTVDSLAPSLQLAHGASFEIVNSNKSAFIGENYIKNGDVLEVIAEDGITTKRFNLVVDFENKQEESDQMLIFPNPADNFISIASEFSANANITIYDMQGKLVLNQQNQSGQIDISQLSQGIYTVILIDVDKKHIQRLVKK